MKQKQTSEEFWQDAKTLGETIYLLVKLKKTKEAEFQALLTYFGRAKVLAIYEDEKKKREK